MHGMKSAANIHSAQAHQCSIILYCIIHSYHFGGGGGGGRSLVTFTFFVKIHVHADLAKVLFLVLVLHVLVCGMHDKLTVICVGHRETGAAERKHQRIETGE